MPSPSLDPAIAAAIHTRHEFGLRSDVAYVESVAKDPRASDFELAIPLLPDEVAELNARRANVDLVAPVIRGYGARHSDEFGGMFIDPLDQGRVVALFAGHVVEHEAALRELLPSDARFTVRTSRYPEAELRLWQDRITADGDGWWAKGILLMGIGADPILGAVRVDLSSLRADAVCLVEAAYGPIAFVRNIDPTGVYILPWGTVAGTVVDEQGRRVRGRSYSLNWSSDGPGECGGGDVAFGTTLDGTFELPCSSGKWTLRLVDSMHPGDVYGEGRFIVRSSERSTGKIVVKSP